MVSLLEYAPTAADGAASNINGLPRAALVELPTELWQVVLFWVVRRLHNGLTVAELGTAHAKLLRFALFWRLCVYDHGRAATWAFEVLKEDPHT